MIKRQTIIVSAHPDPVAGTGYNFNVNFNLRFSPDEVIVRQLSYSTAGDAEDTVVQLYTNMVDDLVLCTFPVFINANPNPMEYQLENHFNLHRKFVSASYNFQLININNPGVIPDIQGTITVTLEFVQYPDK